MISLTRFIPALAVTAVIGFSAAHLPSPATTASDCRSLSLGAPMICFPNEVAQRLLAIGHWVAVIGNCGEGQTALTLADPR